MDEKMILADGKNAEVETAKGWAVLLRRGRYLRNWDRTTDRVEGITSHPEEAFLTTAGEAARLADANADEADEPNFPKVVFVIVNTTVIVPDKED